jgi:hypothetical protein
VVKIEMGDKDGGTAPYLDGVTRVVYRNRNPLFEQP